MVFKSLLVFFFSLFVFLLSPAPPTAGVDLAPQPDAPVVVVSIAPLSFLVSGVMEGVARPHVLVPAGASPHSYALRPGDARLLGRADLIFWGGAALETFLARPLDTLARFGREVALVKTPGLLLLPVRPAGWNNAHTAAIDSHGAVNMHFWLSTENAQSLVDEIAAELIKTDPSHANRFRANADRMKQQLSLLKTQLEDILESVRDRPFMTYHDAYRYFENEFGLNSKGILAINPDVPMGAASLAKLQHSLKDSGIVCLFSEAQFRPGLIGILTERTNIRVAALDPLGEGIDQGPEGYFILMRRLGKSFHRCLSS